MRVLLHFCRDLRTHDHAGLSWVVEQMSARQSTQSIEPSSAQFRLPSSRSEPNDPFENRPNEPSAKHPSDAFEVIATVSHQSSALAESARSASVVNQTAASHAQLAKQLFYTESVADLTNSLRDLGISLLDISSGDRNQAILALVIEREIDCVILPKSYNSRDTVFDRELERALATLARPTRVQTFETRTLLSLDWLPFSLSKMPRVFTPFYKQTAHLVEHIEAIPNALASNALASSALASSALASSAAARYFASTQTESEPLESSVGGDASITTHESGRGFRFAGGEAAGLNRLHQYLFMSREVDHYKETRNGMLDANESSKLSPWLAMGCLSVRRVHTKLKAYELQYGANPSTEWLRYELFWRDYFKFLALAWNERFFASSAGFDQTSEPHGRDRELWRAAWINGETESDFVNANMIELRETGWMSNRGRQNVASYFAKTLGLNWLEGADWFAQNLVDEDPESNFGNWLYLSGFGTDPRNRVFDVDRQASIYDANHEYRNRWLQ